MGFIEDFVDQFGGVTQTTETTSAVIFLMVLGLVVLFGGLGLFALARWFFSKIQYPSGYPISPFRIWWMGGSAYVEGNLSKDDSFDEEKLEKINEYYDGKNLDWKTVEIMMEKGDLHVYRLKITDEVDDLDVDGNTVGILSPRKLESEEYSWLDKRGKRSITSVWTPVKRRNVTVHDTSREIKTFDEDGNPIVWWVLNPIQLGVRKQNYYRVGVHEGEYINIEIQKIENAKGIIEQAEISTTFTEAIEKNNYLAKEKSRFEKLYNDTMNKLTEKNIDVNNLDESLAQKKYIDLGKDEKTTQESSPVIWIIVGIFLSGILGMMLPEIAPANIDRQVAYFGGLFAGLLITLFAYNYISNKNKPVEEKKYEGFEQT